MYLTKMPLNRRRRGAVKLLSSPQAMHAAVQSAFPPDNLRSEAGRALWRVDSSSQDTISLFIASPTEPDLSHIVEQAGWQTGDMWKTLNYGGFLDRIESTQRWAFRLRANPVRSGKHPDSSWSDTKPIAHVTAKQQLGWLLDRAGKAGFSIPDGPHGEAALQIIERSTLKFRKGGHTVTIATATYDGVLEVTDPDVLRHTLSFGLGRAKAYGCGLMTLAPLHGG